MSNSQNSFQKLKNTGPLKKLKNISRIKSWVLHTVIVVIALMAFLHWWAQATCVNRFSILDRIVSESTDGDVTTYTLNLTDVEQTGEYSLHFKSYGNAIQILADGEEIYSYGFDYMQKKSDVGRIYVSAFLPENCKNLEIMLTASDANASSNISKLELCSTYDTGRYYLSNDTLGLPMAILYVVIGLVSLVVGISIGKKDERHILEYFALILMCMAVELADTGGHYLVFFRNQHTWNILFYFASYILPIAAPGYGYALMGRQFPKKQRRIAYLGIWICLLYGVLATVLTLTTRLRFCDFAFWSPVNITISILFGTYSMIYALRKGIVKQKTFLLFSIGTLGWGLLAILFLLSDNQTVNMHVVTKMDMESLQAILLISVLRTTLYIFFDRKLREFKEQQTKTLQLENELLTMQYKVFVSQMQPHFLYNALSSIRQIVYESPDYASELLRDFTVHLRATIRALSNDRMISFAEELKNIKAYVKIEQMRFGDKLNMHYDIETDDFEIIPLSIQPLVENSIRHGIYHRGEKGGNITLRTRETDTGWTIEVIDDGVGFDPEKVFAEVESGERDSTGLKSLLFRMEDIMHAQVEISSIIGEGTHITITIPDQDEEM